MAGLAVPARAPASLHADTGERQHADRPSRPGPRHRLRRRAGRLCRRLRAAAQHVSGAEALFEGPSQPIPASAWPGRPRPGLPDGRGCRGTRAALDAARHGLVAARAGRRGFPADAGRAASGSAGRGTGASRGVACDALVLSTTANQTGLIGLSGLAGREQDLADLLDDLRPALRRSTGGSARITAWRCPRWGSGPRARPILERSSRQSAQRLIAHSIGHLHYGTGDHAAPSPSCAAGCRAIRGPGRLHGHLHWHLALSELQSGNRRKGSAC